jgi:hypothetical protein
MLDEGRANVVRSDHRGMAPGPPVFSPYPAPRTAILKPFALGRLDSRLRLMIVRRPRPLDHDEEGGMKYLCLVYNDEEALGAMPEGEFWAFSDEHVALDEELKKSGHSIVAEALQPVHTAMTVRVRDGKLSITDGPFAETKEQLGGIYLIEAGNMDEAIQVAARIPAAQIGSIEVRPVWELRQHAERAWRR